MRDLASIRLDTTDVFLMVDHPVAIQVDSGIDSATAEGNGCLLLRLHIDVRIGCPVPVGLNSQFGHEVQGLWADGEQLDETAEIRLIDGTRDRLVGAPTDDATLVTVATSPIDVGSL